METSSSHIEIKLPGTSLTPNNFSTPEFTGAIAPIPIGSEIKPFPSFDFMFSNRTPSSGSDD